MRVLLDTNVLISAFLFGGVPRQILLLAGVGTYDLVTTASIVMEFERVLLEKFGFRATLVTALRTEVESTTTLAPTTDRPGVLDDPVDDEILAAAVAGNTDFIVSGDRHLLRLESYEGIDVLTPREFIEWLDEPS